MWPFKKDSAETPSIGIQMQAVTAQACANGDANYDTWRELTISNNINKTDQDSSTPAKPGESFKIHEIIVWKFGATEN